MTTLNTKQLRMTNRVAESDLRKKLLNLSTTLYRQLSILHKDKLDAREFIVKVRKCDSNSHPNAIRYLSSGRVQGNTTILPMVPQAVHKQNKYMREIQRLKTSQSKTSHGAVSLPSLSQSSARAIINHSPTEHAKKPSLHFMRASERHYQMQSIKYRNYEKITSLSLDFLK